ncbi:MAG TPA: hypothetical protein VKR58_10570 [Aquella sp.]|nr:hypothetical protein [Aquella sp.]
MHIKTYKDGKILLPLDIRKKYNIGDNSELIITECEDGIKISTRLMLLNKIRQALAKINVQEELDSFRKEEFALEKL